MSNDINIKNVPTNNIPTEKIILVKLYNAKLDIRILFLIRLT